MGKYDPSPRRRRKRTTRRRRSPRRTTRRRYRRRTYDPARKRRKRRSFRKRATGFFGKITSKLEKYADLIGFGVGFGVPAWISIKGKDWCAGSNWYKWFTEGIPHELKTLFGQNPGMSSMDYLAFKFTNPTCSWFAPFWGSIAMKVLSAVDFFGFIPPRVNKIIKKIANGMLIASTIGALAMPGSETPNATSTSNNTTTTATELSYYG